MFSGSTALRNAWLLRKVQTWTSSVLLRCCTIPSAARPAPMATPGLNIISPQQPLPEKCSPRKAGRQIGSKPSSTASGGTGSGGKEDKPETLEAQVLFDADKLDVLGAIGAARTIAYAALDGQPAYAEPSEKFLKTGVKEPGEPHSSYHEFLFKLQKVKSRMFTSAGKALAEARHTYLVGFYEQLQAEARGER